MGAHLWEPKHPYYCNEQQYFGTGSSGPVNDHKRSWAEFIDEYAEADPDYNLVFRWDWKCSTDDEDEPKKASDDPNYRDSVLTVYWMIQRKGFHRSTTVEVCRNDEPAVRKFLADRWEHMRKLWAPISEAPDGR